MKVISKNLFFRSVSQQDSEFIFNLRTSKGKFINNVGYSKEINKNYISESIIKESKELEYYFIISDSNEDVGVVRIYDLNKIQKTFTWGSWIILDGKSPLYALISAVMIYAFAFDYLGMEKSFFDVRNENIKVKSFHEKTGAEYLNKNEKDTFFSFDKKNYQILRRKYQKYIGDIKILDNKKLENISNNLF